MTLSEIAHISYPSEGKVCHIQSLQMSKVKGREWKDQVLHIKRLYRIQGIVELVYQKKKGIVELLKDVS